ncbi:MULTISPECIES: cell division protein ZipA C-terminal FtsZ-binding domain-containing protein [unclassified Halomonas]|uniref:cell division protein ZipA C-terminal FtsZ-binding domain-containing protein n=1 Tax=unclassified Halomonas TaxID=2609666 RepID=UPI0007D9FA14|nr:MULTISPECIES: cell division protein ZipA C-terminal FtsZ-binding domain-containing protein [unclassified Halomonas]MBT2786248.1 hypothetical protein [Halomonas sp. ISL-106]MBT2797270.1 hypothetical protein [Halomonas sp. ISL-104]OAL58645.1 hypothetical protein A6R74_07065 [Halomonas sp. ALS9]
MDRTTAIILLAFASLVLGAMATAIFIYVIVPWRRRRRAAKEKAANPASTQANSPPEPSETSTPAKRTNNVKQHSLFIIFDQPSERSDEQLTEWLREKDAHYEPLRKVFLINGQQPANPITIANAFLPGELPDLFRDESGSEIIKGISLIVKPPLRKRRNQQMIVFVEIAKEAATLFNANVLDTDHQTATEETYAQIIGE